MLTKRERKLITAIMVTFCILIACISIDYATTPTSKETNTTLQDMEKNYTIINGTYYTVDEDSVIIPSKSDKLNSVKTSAPTITIKARSSCGCGGYYWITTTFINYCPHCHKYGTLYNAHKYPARYEQELTCNYCGADYCGVCGKEKYNWSKYYLRRC